MDAQKSYSASVRRMSEANKELISVYQSIRLRVQGRKVIDGTLLRRLAIAQAVIAYEAATWNERRMRV